MLFWPACCGQKRRRKARRRGPGFVVLTRRAPATLREPHFVAEWTVGGEYGMLCNRNDLCACCGPGTFGSSKNNSEAEICAATMS